MSIALTDVSGIGGTLEEKLNEYGIESVEELAKADADPLTAVKGLKTRKAENLIEKARAHLDDVWDNRQWDSVKQEWYDAGPDSYECVCGFGHTKETIFNVHQNRCQVYHGMNSVTCEECGETHESLADDKITIEEGDHCPTCGHEIGADPVTVLEEGELCPQCDHEVGTEVVDETEE